MKYALIFLLFFSAVTVEAQQFYPIWPAGKKPNSNSVQVTDSISGDRVHRVGTPGIYAFPVEKEENTGTAVLICPGGGYSRLSHIYSGFQLARWFNAQGINAFVLLYRLPHQPDIVRRELAPIQDAQRAMRYLRKNASTFRIDTTRLGAMGVSAGGHLASSVGTLRQDFAAVNDDVDKAGFRPDFLILLSPVITMGEYTHRGSKRNLLGSDTTKAMVMKWSNEFNVTTATPPAFIVHANNDSAVSVRNSLAFHQALVEKKVDASLHIFPQGGHAIKTFDNPGSTAMWLSLLELWLKEKGFVASPKK